MSFWLLLCGVLNVNGIDLQCTNTTLINSFEFSTRTGCRVSNVNIQSRGQVITSVNGQDLTSFTGSSSISYKSIEIKHREVHFIPQGLGEFFPDLEGLDISSSQTKEVTKSDFDQFPKLKELYLYFTNIQSLPADLFEGNPELLYIYLGHNKLTHVGKGILTPLKKLHSAYFSSNPCTDIYVFNDRSKIPTLVTALESGCRNDTIDELNKKIVQQKSTSACEPLRSLAACNEELKKKLESKDKLFDAATRYIYSNPPNNQEISSEAINIKCKFILVDSSCEVFDFVVDTPGSKIVDIITENRTKITKSSSSIEKLLIIDQQTLFLPLNLAEILPKVTELVITDSGLSQINQETFTGLKLLISLKITYNKIREIPEQFVSESSNLKELNLTSNRLEVIAENAFSGLGKLEELDMSHNLLISVHSEVFSSLNSLKTLKINNNKLQFLSPRLFYATSELVSLDISSRFRIESNFK